MTSGQKRVFLVAEYVSSSPHIEISLEVARVLAEQGHEVYYRHLGRALPFVDFRRVVPGVSQKVSRAVSDFVLGNRAPLKEVWERIRRTDPKVSSGIDFAEVKSLPRLPSVPIDSAFLGTIKKLSQFVVDERPLGIGLANSVAGVAGDTNPNLRAHRRTINSALESQLRAAKWLEGVISDYDISDVVVFNGRFAVAQAIAIVSRENGCSTWFHERGATDDLGFMLLPFRPHSASKLGQYMSDRYERGVREIGDSASNAAREFFAPEKRALSIFDSKPWTRLGSIPKTTPVRGSSTEARKLQVVYFSSTEGEYEFLGDEQVFSLFESQREAVVSLALMAERLDFELVVRVHPHVANQKKDERTWWDGLETRIASQNVSVVGSTSDIDSFWLMEQSDCVVTWYSTMSLHAVYAGKPSIALHESSYQHCGAEVRLATSLAHLEALILDPPVIQDRDSVLAWAFHVEVSEHKYRWFTAEGYGLGLLLGLRAGRGSRVRSGRNFFRCRK
jgi:hypothetical protein